MKTTTYTLIKKIRKRTRTKKGKENETLTNVQGAGRVPRRHRCYLLVRSVLLWFVQLMDQPKSGTKRPDGRLDKKTAETQLTKKRAVLYQAGGPTTTLETKKGQRRTAAKEKSRKNSRRRVTRARGGTIGLAGNRATQQTKTRDCNTVRSGTNDAKIIWKIIGKSPRAFGFSIKNAV